MKRTSIILVIIIIFIGCHNRDSSDDNCISYIDSLKINLENSELQVSLIDLAQEHKIRPYTLIYDNHLIVLNKADSFYSFTTDCFQRDIRFENRLNSQRFKKSLIISDTLYGIDSVNQSFRFDENRSTWVKQSRELPFFNSAPICETDKYICYSICHGEFGGIVFFYNKINQRITYAPATCTVSLMKFNDGFYVVSNLAHLSSFTYVNRIDNPDSLYVLPDSLYKADKFDRIYYTIFNDTSFYKQITPIFDDLGKLISSGFRIKGESYFLTKMNISDERRTYKYRRKTYLSKIANDSLIVINTTDTIFSSLPASNGELTRKNKSQTVIDYTLFANDTKNMKESDERNLLLTTFILTDTTLIRLNWKD